MSIRRIGDLCIFRTKAINFLILMFLIFIITAGCATQHKYKKYKPIPCPCEKENKR
jgi:large-conductance mechanosensitive channel